MNSPDLTRLRLDDGEKNARHPLRARWVLIGAVITVAVIAVLWVSMRSSGSDTAVDPVPETLAAGPEPSAVRANPSSISAGGYIEARRTSVLSPGRTGVIEAIYVERGERVKQGAILLELESHVERAQVEMDAAALERVAAEFEIVLEGPRRETIAAARADVEAAEAELNQLKRDLVRAEDLASKGVIADADLEASRSRVDAAADRLQALRANQDLLEAGNRPAEIESARAAVKEAQAALRRSRATLDLSTMRAPFDGVVVRVDLEVGETFSLFSGLTGNSGIVLADESALWARVDVPEARIAGIDLGDRAEVFVDALGDARIEADVVEIAPVADRQSNTIEVAVRLFDPPGLIRPDMSARVTIYP